MAEFILALLLASLMFVGAIYNIVKLAQQPSGFSVERVEYAFTAIVYTFFLFFLIILLLGLIDPTIIPSGD